MKKDYVTGDLVTMVILRRKLENNQKLSHDDRIALFMIFKHYAMVLKDVYEIW